MSSSVRHPDFDKIHATFMQHYSKDPALFSVPEEPKNLGKTSSCFVILLDDIDSDEAWLKCL